MHKLNILGSQIISCMPTYLTNGFQVVKIGTSMSGKCIVESGVHQKSQLGPVLFLLFFNDLSDIIKYFISLYIFDKLNNFIYLLFLKHTFYELI